MTSIRRQALSWIEAGISVVPIKPDGTKGPSVRWRDYQDTRMTPDEVDLHFTSGMGIAVICGEISGGLEVLDFDLPKAGTWTGHCFFDDWVEGLDVDLYDLVRQMPKVRTPGGGVHLYYRCPDLDGNRKLAVVVERDVIPPKQTVIETRSEGGYVLAPGCPPACHPSGKTYEIESGSFESVPTITPKQRQSLFAIARSFDQSGLEEKEQKRAERQIHPKREIPERGDGLKPGDDYNQRGSWAELLEPLGWTFGYTRRDGARMWRRPGKRDRGVSATVRELDGVELFHAFTSNCDPFPQEESINKFQAYALIFHNGDFSAAARDLGAQGYGDPPKSRGSSWTPNEEDPASVIRGDDVPWSYAGEDDRSYHRDVAPETLQADAIGAWDEDDEDFAPPWEDDDLPLEGKPVARSRIIEAAPDDGAPRPAGDAGRIGIEVSRGDEDITHSDEERAGRDIAARLIREYHVRRDDAKCIYIYQNSVWQETSREFLEKLAMQYDTFAHVEMKILREGVNLAITRRHVQRMFWNQIGETEVSVRNGVLDFMTGKIRSHDPADYVDRLIDCDYDPKATCPVWRRCLDEWLPGMYEEQDALQQFFGYILMNHALYKKALLLYGKRDTGKSMVCNVAKALAGGERFTCSITPDEMDDPRKLAPIKGKAINIVPDLAKDTVFSDGGFKRLVSTGDMIKIDQKFKAAESYIPTAKHIFATNNLPTIKDVTDAVFERLLFLTFDVRIPRSKQDRSLERKLKAELSGILNWAVEGARKLHLNEGHWPRVKSSEALDQNALVFYINEAAEVVYDPNTFVSSEKLRKKMNEFIGGKPYGRRGFARLVRSIQESDEAVFGSRRNNISVVNGLNWTDPQMRLSLAPAAPRPAGGSAAVDEDDDIDF
jgi:P4 family phage/plasmid primase-like protien